MVAKNTVHKWRTAVNKKKFLGVSITAASLLFAWLTIHFAPNAEGQSTPGCTDQALALAEGQLTDTIAYTSTSSFPVETNPSNGNKWSLSDASHWTSGFFPGWMWFMYEKTLSDTWLTRAQQQTATMQGQDTNAIDHDIGFKMLGSFANGYRITRDPAYMTTIQTGANAMATNLWRPGAGVIESWPNYDSHITVIIDNMMNLELLFLAAENGGDPNWYNMAVSHALKTRQNHVRADGSTYHVVDYNTDGTVFSKFTVQGAGTETTWSRGQAWGLYGFTMTYRYTKDARFLGTAQQLADYFINNLPADFVPYWDFSKSGTAPRDSSAAAIAAAGLLELSTFVATQADKDRYRTAALNIQTSLSSASYLGDRLATDGILLHGSANVPGGDSDKSLVYGDYYFIQGCYRAKTPPPAPANFSAVVASSTGAALRWDAETGAVRYNVKRSTSSGGPYTTIAPPPVLTTNTFSDTGLAAGNTYYYVVSATGIGGEGPNSTVASVTTPTNNAATSTSLTSSANPAAFGAPVTFTATVKPATSGTPSGTVTFKNGTVSMGTGTLRNGQAVMTRSNLSVGSHSITAIYGGDANFTGSASAVLTQNITSSSSTGTSTSLVSSANPAAFGGTVTFTATVKPVSSGTPSGTVTFKDGTVSMGTGTLRNGQATMTRSNLSAGSHSITAIYGGDANFTGSTSPVLTQTISGSAAATSTTLVSSANPSVSGQSVTFTATVKPATSGAPSGTVTFKDGTISLGTGTLRNSQAIMTRSTLSVGSHSITAIYGGDANFKGSTSAALTQVVNP
jgi:unsaturated chondroitin disaccharide hydrolase